LQIRAQLTDEEKTNLEELFLAHSDGFALTDEELGETDLVSHRTNTGGTAPVKMPPWRLTYALRQEL